MKAILLTSLQAPSLDLAVFHAHGSEDLQYIIGSPTPFTADQHIDAVKKFVRGKMAQAKRRKKSVDEALDYYVKQYDIPRSWFANAFADSITAADSVADYKLDIHLEDIAAISPQARFIMFDECFNGNYTAEDYVAGKYIFGPGKTVASVANSVNVLQDQWANEHLGLLNFGVRVGAWHRSRRYLESHIIGDPTFRYASSTPNDIGGALVLRAKDAGYWKKLSASADPSLRALGVSILFSIGGASYEKDLVATYRRDASFNVRLAALRCLATLRSPAFETVLHEAAVDPYEYIRRLTAMWMGEVGRPEYLPALSVMTLSDVSERVKYNSREAMERISPARALEAMRAAIAALPAFPPTEKILADYTRSLTYARTKVFTELIPNTLSDTLTVKKRVGAIRNFRVYNYHEAVPTLVSIATKAAEHPQVRAAALEAMGWYSLAVERPVIIDACVKIAADAAAPEAVRQAAVQTKNRLAGGPNEVLTP